MSERAEQAWHELRGEQQAHSLALLLRRANTPVTTVRCTTDRELAAVVWRTSGGPLLVTGHRGNAEIGPARRPVPGTGVFMVGHPVQGMIGNPDAGVAGRNPWTPRLALASESMVEAFPLLCPRCNRTMALTPEKLADAVIAALGSAPRHIQA